MSSRAGQDVGVGGDHERLREVRRVRCRVAISKIWDYSQDSLGSYGRESFQVTRAAAKKHDLMGISQSKVRGDFTTSNSPLVVM